MLIFDFYSKLDVLDARLRQFSLTNATCTCCSTGHTDREGKVIHCDRKIIIQCLCQWFGSEAASEANISSTVADSLRDKLSRFPFQYWMFLSFTVPLVWAFMDQLAARIRDEAWEEAGALCFDILSRFFNVLPAVFAFTVTMVHAVQRVRCSRKAPLRWLCRAAVALLHLLPPLGSQLCNTLLENRLQSEALFFALTIIPALAAWRLCGREAKGAKALPQHQQQPRARPRWGTFGRTAPMLLRMQWLLGKAQELKEASPSFVVAGRRVQQRKLLADGGFAYVFAGLDADTGERLAIRRVLLQDKEALAKAKVEIELLSGLCDHPHVVRFQGAEIFQRGAGAEAVYIFELCPNGTLLAHIEAHKDQAKAQGRELLPYCCPCLEEKDILDVLGATAQALAYLTRLGMIHYDVKSENLLLGNDGLWKLGDFGSASEHSFDLEKAEKKALLEAQEFIHGRCTPMYRAPELADVYLRWKIGPKVDIFALGCIIFATMTGQHPFPMESTCGNITASYRLPPEATECYSSVLLGWLRGLLARLPAERPSAVRLAAEVERFKLGEPPAPAPAPATSSARPTKAAPAQTMAAPDASPWQADFATFSPVQDSVNGE
ncbi:unnamed protein product [Effrenium voratum]|uniref:non-specific serine/threonine protein kinase n=1 Tax=Effrenium voratum TaxID=2562239 RepID=A0AA36HME8_9DINO|nr:unnamed protein product [Effrenium voratum]